MSRYTTTVAFFLGVALTVLAFTTCLELGWVCIGGQRL